MQIAKSQLNPHGKPASGLLALAQKMLLLLAFLGVSLAGILSASAPSAGVTFNFNSPLQFTNTPSTAVLRLNP